MVIHRIGDLENQPECPEQRLWVIHRIGDLESLKPWLTWN